MPFASFRGLAAALLTAALAASQAPAPRWIWHPDASAATAARRVFTLPAAPRRATLWATADNHVEVWVNGERVLQSSEWQEVDAADVTARLRAGDNVVAVHARNDGGPAGIALRLRIENDGAEATEVLSDATWRCGTPQDDAWRQVSSAADGWVAAQDLGAVGADGGTWTRSVDAAAFAQELGGPQQQPPAPADGVEVADGFRVERLYTVPRPSQGSWVSLARGPDGSLFASDQRGKGLFRIWPAAAGDPAAVTRVERLPVELSHAQGLLWAFDSLYVVKNGPGSGLYRVRDSDGDATLDQVELLTELAGSGEHGPHAVVLAPDGESLYVACGNHTKLPRDAIDRSRAPMDWDEDLLLPRMWDARGHARGILAPGGYICRVDPDGESWEVVANGFRNQYDVAFDPAGELFSYDADMEWDMGMPWYRPTRICHVVSGAEFGWRAGSGKWPAYSPDSVPAAVDIGPGSPTGLVFGTGAAFPERYARALYALDWTFGTIWAVHLRADGAGYAGELEPFVTGAPLPVTDAVVGEDGALYFTTGGRGVQSHLYRVLASGEHAVAALEPQPEPAERTLRRQLERLHGQPADDPERALSWLWQHLGHGDRLVRYAARLALEAQPVELWAQRARAEQDPVRAAHALLALARRGDPAQQSALLDSLDRLALDHADDQVVLATLRAYGLAFLRQGAPDDALRARLGARLDAAFPCGRADLDVELARLLAYLRVPGVVRKAMPLITDAAPVPAPEWGALIERNDRYGGPIRRMLADMPPMRGLLYALLLRTVHDGWTPELRRAYFGFLATAEGHAGGESYRGFITMIRNEALASCSDAERAALRDVLAADGAAPEREPPAPVALAGPARAWTVDDATAAVERHLRKRDYQRGRALFFTVSCAACHRFDGEGGQTGPDLTSAGNKFGARDLLEAILEPSKAISDQYGSSIVTKRDGSSVFGRVVTHEDGHLEVFLPVAHAPPVVVPESEVQTVSPSPISQMPPGLVNLLNEDELRDLVAYLLSRANANDSMFR